MGVRGTAEKIAARATLALDPADPRNGEGRVEGYLAAALRTRTAVRQRRCGPLRGRRSPSTPGVHPLRHRGR